MLEVDNYRGGQRSVSSTTETGEYHGRQSALKHPTVHRTLLCTRAVNHTCRSVEATEVLVSDERSNDISKAVKHFSQDTVASEP